MGLCMEIPTGVMVSPASLASLGSARGSYSSHLEASPLILAKRRIHVVSRLNFNNSCWKQRWVLQYRGISFKCNIITNLIDEKGVSSSLESVFLACSADKEENTDLILKATTNSVSHDEPIGPIKLKNYSASSNDGVLTGKRLETRDDRETVLKPLREVMGKAVKVDKLETGMVDNPAKLNDIEIRSNAKQNGGSKPHRSVKTNNAARNSKTIKNVWRRGDPMKNIHNEVREVPRISKEELEERKSPLVSRTSKQDPSSANVLKLQKPIPVSPNPVRRQQASCSVTPLPSHQTIVLKPPLVGELKAVITDKFASKEPIADLITSETVLATTKPVKGLLSKSKERWKKSSVAGGLQKGMIDEINVITSDEDPIIHKHHFVESRKPTLIDRFSMKKAVVDSIASEGELTLTKPIKGPPTKFKEEHRKKFSVDGDLGKREVDDDDVDIIEEDPIIQKPHYTKQRRPILIDKFSSKKSIGDSIVSEAVLASTKSVKGPSSKLKVEHSKKSNSDVGGLRKRLAEENDADIIEEDALELNVPISAVRKGKKWTKASRKAARLKAAKTDAPVKAEILEIGNEGMFIEELAYNLAVNAVEITEYLCSKGIKSDTVRVLDKDMVKMICKDYDVEVIEAQVTLQEMAKKKEILDEEDLNMLEVRPPVITIMGHVDHGKTTLLDCIRNSKVVASEFGGITQGIGAYKVQVIVDSKPQYCVFLDTPGHEAFGAMRARGARVTDITIIVVAADDGVRPQTTEAIAHSKAAEVPIVIAINKMDKDGANPDRVMQELSHAGLMPEEWGGHIPMVKISALKNENVDQLLETVMLVAEMQELRANPHRKAKGTCIEAGLEKQRGPVSTFIVQNGTLRKGDIVVCGEAFGKARALFDDRGIRVDEVGPSMAVQVIGLSNVPTAGDEFEIASSLDLARQKAETCAESLRASRLTAKAGETKITLSSLASAVSAGKQSGVDRHQLNIILKADVQGSIEAIKQAIHVLPQDNVTLKFLHKAPGDVSASDVDLAVVAKAIIFGFNVKALGSVKSYADRKNVEIRLYRVIYDLIDEMRNAMEGLLELAEEQIPIGVAEVRATFSSGSGRVAGCMITEGKLMKGCGLRVIRNGMTIYTGVIVSLRRIKEVVEEVGAGLECGVGVDTFSDWAIQDVIEAFETIKKRRTLEEASASVTAALTGAGIER